MSSGGSYAVITGASRGLGKYFARALAARGQNLILVARSQDKLEQVAGALREQFGVSVKPLALDLARHSAGKELARQLATLDCNIELLVNNAGFGERGEFIKLPLDRQLEMIQLHDTTVVELTYELLPEMIKNRRGGIINVSSIAGLQPVPYAALYSASKSFLTNFSMALREELRPTQVKVVTVCPHDYALILKSHNPKSNDKRCPVANRLMKKS